VWVPAFPARDGTGKQAAVGGRIPSGAGRKLRTENKLLGNCRMLGTVTAAGRTSAVAAPTSRRGEAEDG